jgi:hypothetical protein
MYVYFYESIFQQIYLYNFHICKLNNLKVINDLHSQCLTKTLS